MFNERNIVHDTEQLQIAGVEYVSYGVYKVHCDIVDKINGIYRSQQEIHTSQQRAVRCCRYSVHFMSQEETYVSSAACV